ncbi:hypothetical protein ACSZOL_05300 [Aeromonas hydrophila]|nr:MULTISPECIES: hypothetical protein [Aeromonas]MDD9227571.1 hypothetical protein [Aeromonas hydrophila]WEA28866.1 hypothetical protein PWO56_16465 [Aeromonas hydrophila]
MENITSANPLFKALEAGLLAALAILIKDGIQKMQTPPEQPKDSNSQ